MVAGHFGLAAGVKSWAPSAPLWALMVATQWLDIFFVPLFLLGIETIDPVDPAHPNAYGASIIHANYTHSLVGALGLAAVFGAVSARAWGRRVGVVLGAVVFSHWILDLVVHRGDLPVLPGDVGGLPRFGFGLWQFPAVAAGLELALVIGGGYLYWRAATQLSRASIGVPAWRAQVAGALTLASGVLILAMDVLGILA